MASKHYWTESLMELCSDYGFTPDENFIDGVMGIAENESLACGYDCIGSPSESEADRLKKEIADLKHAHMIQLRNIADNFADANGWDRDKVSIQGDTMMFEKSWLR